MTPRRRQAGLSKPLADQSCASPPNPQKGLGELGRVTSKEDDVAAPSCCWDPGRHRPGAALLPYGDRHSLDLGQHSGGAGSSRLEPPPEKWHSLVGADALAAHYFQYGISIAARASYDAPVNSFVRFRRPRGFAGAVSPALAHEVEVWVAAEGARLASAGEASGRRP